MLLIHMLVTSAYIYVDVLMFYPTLGYTYSISVYWTPVFFSAYCCSYLTSSAPQTNFSVIDMEIDGKGRGIGELDEPDALSNPHILLSPSIDINECKSKEFNEKTFLPCKKSTLFTQKPVSTYSHWLI